MFRVAIIAAFLVQVISVALAVKIPVSQFNSRIYREPPIPDAKSPRVPVLEYVEQDVDNFDPNNDATYRMVR